MGITGKDAATFLTTLEDRVELFKKDNTDKFWSYKLKSGKKTEFAFDPNTKTGLFIRVDREPPSLPGISNIERIAGKSVSTALGRVFSGGLHKASYVVTVRDSEALESLIGYYESL